MIHDTKSKVRFYSIYLKSFIRCFIQKYNSIFLNEINASVLAIENILILIKKS